MIGRYKIFSKSAKKTCELTNTSWNQIQITYVGITYLVLGIPI